MAEDAPSVTPRRQHGHSRAYILDRLKRENQIELAAAVEAGTVSAFAAAVQCGWTKRPQTLGGDNTPQARRRRHRLQAITDGGTNLSQLMELWLGPSADGSLFSSREELQQAWERHGEAVMAMWGRSGRRPQIWWELEAPALGLKWPGYFNEQSYLFEHNVLSEQESVELLTFWRKEFERTYNPNFFYTEAPGKILEGAAARKKHFDWADIPTTLRWQWRTERRRRPRAEGPEKALSAASGTEGEEKSIDLRLERSAAAETLK
jgi:hypothetical protein